MKLVVLNHKMNLNYEDIQKYITDLENYRDKIVVLPSAIYAKEFIEHGFITGLQNIYCREKGMYTGEISPVQAQSLGAKYVLVGHSERRRLFAEDDILINEKIKMALKNHLKVILCVGDEIGDPPEVLASQITKALKGITEEVIIAYEPVYAIGTGKVPKIEDIKKQVEYIKNLVNHKVLYGGSVSTNNIKSLEQLDNIDGYLIGTSSLSSAEVIKILEVVE